MRTTASLQLLAAGAVAVLLAGCSSGHRATAASTTATAASSAATAMEHVQGHAGALVGGDGFVREPASPDVAAAYLTVVNNGGTAVRLSAVHSKAAPMVMPMTETSSSGVGSMTPLKDVVIPPHGEFRFHPGGAHLMLEQPNPTPAVGDTVSLALTFTPDGGLTVVPDCPSSYPSELDSARPTAPMNSFIRKRHGSCRDRQLDPRSARPVGVYSGDVLAIVGWD